MIKYTKLDLYKMTSEELNKVLEVFLRGQGELTDLIKTQSCREDELMETTITVRAHSRVNLDEWPPV